MVNNFSFSKNTFNDVYLIAKKAYTIYCEAPLSTQLADDLAQKIWHCTDYIHREGLCGCKSNLRGCASAIRKRSRAMAAINDICDSNKHAGIDRKKLNLDKSDIRKGSFSSDFCFSSFETYSLYVVFPDGEKVDFDTIARDALAFIGEFKNENFN